MSAFPRVWLLLSGAPGGNFEMIEVPPYERGHAYRWLTYGGAILTAGYAGYTMFCADRHIYAVRHSGNAQRALLCRHRVVRETSSSCVREAPLSEPVETRESGSKKFPRSVAKRRRGLVRTDEQALLVQVVDRHDAEDKLSRCAAVCADKSEHGHTFPGLNGRERLESELRRRTCVGDERKLDLASSRCLLFRKERLELFERRLGRDD